MTNSLFTSDLGFDIPREAVTKLQREATDARETIKRYTAVAEDRERKLAAIKLLAPHHFDEPKRVLNLEEGEESATSKSLIDAVVKAVDRSGGLLSPKDIRRLVHEQGDGALIGNETYLYTAIKRAADSGRIDKQDGAYVSVL